MHCYHPLFLDGDLRVWEARRLTLGCTASKWLSWDFHPDSQGCLLPTPPWERSERMLPPLAGSVSVSARMVETEPRVVSTRAIEQGGKAFEESWNQDGGQRDRAAGMHTSHGSYFPLPQATPTGCWGLVCLPLGFLPCPRRAIGWPWAAAASRQVDVTSS